MAEIKVPIQVKIQVNLPDDWVEQIVNRLRNDPDAEWAEIIHCKDCKWYVYGDDEEEYYCRNSGIGELENFFCADAERKNNV